MLPANMANIVSVAHLIFNVKGPLTSLSDFMARFSSPTSWKLLDEYFPSERTVTESHGYNVHIVNQFALKRSDTRLQNFGYSTSVKESFLPRRHRSRTYHIVKMCLVNLFNSSTQRLSILSSGAPGEALGFGHVCRMPKLQRLKIPTSKVSHLAIAENHTLSCKS